MTLREYLKDFVQSQSAPSSGFPLLNTNWQMISWVPFFLSAPQFQWQLANWLCVNKGDYEIKDRYITDDGKANTTDISRDLTVVYVANKYMLEGLNKTTELTYDPIQNYNMSETGKDTHSGNDVTTDKIGEGLRTENLGNQRVDNTIGSRQDTFTEGGQTNTTTDRVSPDERTNFINRNQQEYDKGQRVDNSNIGIQNNHTTINAVTNTYTDNSRQDESTLKHGHIIDHTLKRQGNIGITTTQQMIEAEREVRNFNIYKVIGDLIVHQICKLVWAE